MEIGEQSIPIVISKYCNGDGYAINIFYPLLVTYLPMLIKLVVPTYTIALKVFGILMTIISGITMYNLTQEVTKKKWVALFAGIIYIIMPYKLSNLYIRFAIGEFTALAFIPLVFQGLYNLLNGNKKKYYYIIIGAVILMLSHTISSMYTAIFCAIYLIINFRKLKDKDIIKKLLISVIFIILMSMAFIGPLLEAKNAANYTIFDNEIFRTTTNEKVYKNTLDLNNFFKYTAQIDGIDFSIGIVVFIISLLSYFCYRRMSKDTNVIYKKYYIISIIGAVVSLWMSTKLFPWLYVPNILCKIQYPWRMLGYFSLFISMVCAINIEIIVKQIANKCGNKNGTKTVLSILILAMLLISIVPSISGMKLTLAINAEQKNISEEQYEELEKQAETLSHFSINREYLPVNAIKLQSTYMKTREERVYVLAGNADISNQEKNKLTMNLDVSNIEQGTKLEFPYIYYPGYIVTIRTDNDAKQIETKESENGYLCIQVNENIEKAHITVQYKNTPITIMSYWITAISTVIFIIFVFMKKFEHRDIDFIQKPKQKELN